MSTKTLLLIVLGMGVGLAQTPSNPLPVPPGSSGTPSGPQIAPGPSNTVKFPLSDTESLKLQNLRLQQKLIEAQIALANQLLANELQGYVSETLKAHGNPVGVTFDPKTLNWVVVPPPQNPVQNPPSPQPPENTRNKVDKK